MTPGNGKRKAVTSWQAGDAIVVEGRHVGDVARTGEVLKALATPRGPTSRSAGTTATIQVVAARIGTTLAVATMMASAGHA